MREDKEYMPHGLQWRNPAVQVEFGPQCRNDGLGVRSKHIKGSNKRYYPSLISFMVSVDGKHHVYLLTYLFIRREPVWPSGKALDW